MNDELSRGDVLLDVLLKNKVELVKDIKGNAILPCSNHETVELKILEDRVRKSKITSLDFKKAGFGLLGDLLGRLNGRLPWRVKGMQDSWLIFKDNLLKAQNQSVAMFRKSSNHGRKPAWVSKELLSSNTRRRYRESGSSNGLPRKTYRDIALACRGRIKEFKAQLELKKKKRDVRGNLNVA